MGICGYVQEQYVKRNFKNDCADMRQFVGLRVVMDSLIRAGYECEWAGIATVHEYDIVLVSLTSDIDWWSYLMERVKWRKGDYKVIAGGAGCMHVVPFLQWVDFFSLGRGEKSVVNLVRKLDGKDGYEDDSIVESATFSPDKKYYFRQADETYPHTIKISDKKDYLEGEIGCPHKCLFCGYTWHRKFLSQHKDYQMSGGLFDAADSERAMLDLVENPDSVDWVHLRTTAIDGLSERLRFMVNKRITRECLEFFVRTMIAQTEAKPHQIRIFNIVGYPTETEDDVREFYDTIVKVDKERKTGNKQWGLSLSSMHFTPTPLSPLACSPIQVENRRFWVRDIITGDQSSYLLYRGDNLYCAEGYGTENIATVMLRVICMRGKADDQENIERLARTKKFWNASKPVQQATIEKYFDIDYLFGEFDSKTLPTRYLRTYAAVERFWDRPPWKEPYIIKPD